MMCHLDGTTPVNVSEASTDVLHSSLNAIWAPNAYTPESESASFMLEPKIDAKCQFSELHRESWGEWSSKQVSEADRYPNLNTA